MSKPKAGGNHVDVEIGLRLRRKRLELDLSQTELGKMLNVSFQQVQKYEKGSNRISCSTLVAICQALKVSTNYFFDGMADVSKRGPSDKERFLATRHGIEGVTALMKLGPKIRDSVIRMAEAAR
jgi:transcriptional regulator with XRE-family HTH domain